VPAVALVAAALCSAEAHATADVFRTAGAITVNARSVSGSANDGDHGIIIENHAVEDFRIRQRSFGDPTITSAICRTNAVFNDVVCEGAFPIAPDTALTVNVNMGDGSDNVEARRDSPPACFVEGSGPRLTVDVSLGAGDDGFEAGGPDDCPAGTDVFRLTLDVRGDAGDDILSALDAFPQGALRLRGGSGVDRLFGSSRADTLEGNDGSDDVRGLDGADELVGGAGDDELDGDAGDDGLAGGAGADSLFGDSGNDQLSGGTGDDTLDGGPGQDSFRGGTGNDTFEGDTGSDTYTTDDSEGVDGADRFSGGGGVDVVNYGPRTVALSVTIGNGQADDGAAGEGDEIVDADQVIGGSARDILVGSGANETLIGNGGSDSLNGGAGQDVLRGGSDGGFPGDSIAAIDGVADTVDCGPGSRDTASVDLQDTLSGCELVLRQPADDSPPGRPATRAVRLSAGTARVRFRCPATAEPSCTGELVLRLVGQGRVLGRTAYGFGLGERGVIRVSLEDRDVALLGRRGRVVVETTEQGHSNIGPRGARYVLSIVS
jgi:Ca2+-binding RTX toxin-like protein